MIMSKKLFDFGEKTYIMGILNVTPNSFSDGGKFFFVDEAVAQAIKMEKEGADIIDIGGESTRPGAKSVSKDEEIKRVIPVIEKLVNKISIPISIDTYKSDVAMKALDIGAHMVNDIAALRGDKKLVNVVTKYDVPICLMHMKGSPQNMQKNPVYKDVIKEIHDFLKERTEYAIANSIKKENIIIDPGLGFGKRTGCGVEDNCEILQRLNEADVYVPLRITIMLKNISAIEGMLRTAELPEFGEFINQVEQQSSDDEAIPVDIDDTDPSFEEMKIVRRLLKEEGLTTVQCFAAEFIPPSENEEETSHRYH